MENKEQNQNEPQKKSSKSYWIFGLIFLALIVFTRNCNNQESSPVTYSEELVQEANNGDTDAQMT